MKTPPHAAIAELEPMATRAGGEVRCTLFYFVLYLDNAINYLSKSIILNIQS